MFFSPISARSLPVRVLYAAFYLILALGGITMVVPFLIMLTGSVEPRAQSAKIELFPAYLANKQELWSRYLEVKYQGSAVYWRMAWNTPYLLFVEPPDRESADENSMVSLWETFLEETQPAEKYFVVGFHKPNASMPSFAAFGFRDWLFAKYGSLEGINKALETSFRKKTHIRPPNIRLDGPSLPDSPFVRAYMEFSASQPPERKFVWDVGGYFRTHILPSTIGADVADYNAQFATSYASYSEVPFPATIPQIGAEPWFFFVSRILRTDFIEISPEGESRRAGMGISREEFIRTRSEPHELRVVSADTLFAEWAADRGSPNARIPQPAMDRAAFAAEAGFWRTQFLTLNYRQVLEEILGHGGAIRNTLILVVLSVGGALLIDPLAAYALSRYKLKKTYYILLFCLATIAFPGEVTMIPVFLQLKELNLLNTFGALVLPGLANGFSIFLLKGFFDSLPKELYEAAEIDGAGEFTTFWLITMNLSKPILAVMALHAFVAAYGAFFFALILAPDPKMWTIMVYIYELRQSASPPVIYASLLVTAIPTLVIFVACQKLILQGIVVPSDK